MPNLTTKDIEAGVLTLAAAPNEAGALDDAAADAAAALRRAGATVGPADRLGPEACDLPFEGIDEAAAIAAARGALGGRPVDAVALPTAGRRKRILVADMESTIIENEMLEELAEPLGFGERVAAITRRAMNGEIEFAGAVRERVALLTGLPLAALEEAARRIRIAPGAQALVATMRVHGAHCVLVSGGFRFFSLRVAGALKFDFDVANELEIESGRLTGRVREPILGREAKLDTLERIADERGVPLALALAVGDGANDLGMLAAAGLGVAFHAKPAVAAEAPIRIDHADLRALLYLQGYRAAEIVGG
jgi:phosphoserine phosphatase